MLVRFGAQLASLAVADFGADGFKTLSKRAEPIPAGRGTRTRRFA